MSTKISYKDRLTPKFDAVNDTKDWFGKRWPEVSGLMSKVKNPNQFSFLATMSGVRGFPVEAWYDLYWGEGAYWKAMEDIEKSDREDGIGE